MFSQRLMCHVLVADTATCQQSRENVPQLQGAGLGSDLTAAARRLMQAGDSLHSCAKQAHTAGVLASVQAHLELLVHVVKSTQAHQHSTRLQRVRPIQQRGCKLSPVACCSPTGRMASQGASSLADVGELLGAAAEAKTVQAVVSGLSTAAVAQVEVLQARLLQVTTLDVRHGGVWQNETCENHDDAWASCKCQGKAPAPGVDAAEHVWGQLECQHLTSMHRSKRCPHLLHLLQPAAAARLWLREESQGHRLQSSHVCWGLCATLQGSDVGSPAHGTSSSQAALV